MTRLLLLVPLAIAALSLALGVGTADGQTAETEDVLKPAFPIPTETYAPGAATLQRDANGFSVHVQIPTPVSGTYNYPDGAQPGVIEVFTLWAIPFNYPELCTEHCDFDDLGDAAAARGGVYHVDGVVARSATLEFSGRIEMGVSTPYEFSALEAPLTAHIHLAVAPHGAYDPSDPSQLTTPIGSPSCACWWVAFFEDPPAERAEATAAGEPAVLPAAGSGGLAAGAGASPLAWASVAAGATLAAGVGVRVARRRRHA